MGEGMLCFGICYLIKMAEAGGVWIFWRYGFAVWDGQRGKILGAMLSLSICCLFLDLGWRSRLSDGTVDFKGIRDRL